MSACYVISFVCVSFLLPCFLALLLLIPLSISISILDIGFDSSNPVFSLTGINMLGVCCDSYIYTAYHMYRLHINAGLTFVFFCDLQLGAVITAVRVLFSV